MKVSGVVVLVAAAILSLVPFLTVKAQPPTLVGETLDLEMNGPPYGKPDFFLWAKQDGNRTGQFWHYIANSLGHLDASQGTALGLYGWQGTVTEIDNYDLLDDSLVWVREDNYETFNATAENFRFCALIENNATVCIDYWRFIQNYTLHFNYLGQFGGFELDHTLQPNDIKFGVTITNWSRNRTTDYCRLSFTAINSEPLNTHEPILTPTSWKITLGPVDITKAYLNLTLLSFGEENGQLRYLTWTPSMPLVENGTETTYNVTVFHHFIDMDVATTFYYDPDFRAFFGGVSTDSDDEDSGDGDNTVLIAVLVAVLTPTVILTLVVIAAVVAGIIFLRRQIAFAQFTSRVASALERDGVETA